MRTSKLRLNKYIRECKIEKVKLNNKKKVNNAIIEDCLKDIEKNKGKGILENEENAFVENCENSFQVSCNIEKVEEEAKAEKGKKKIIVKLIRKIKKRPFIVASSFVVVLLLIGAGAFVGHLASVEAQEVLKFERKVAEAEVEIAIANQALEAIEKEVDIFTHSEIWEMDLSQPSGVTAEELAPLLKGGTVGLEEAFIEAEKTHNVNAMFLVSIAALESAWGTINFRPNNMFGYGSSGYATKEDNIMAVAEGLGNNYLHPSGSLYSGTTATDVNKRYATSSKWDDKVVNQMASLYSDVAIIQQESLDEALEEQRAVIAALEHELELIKAEEKEREKFDFVVGALFN